MIFVMKKNYFYQPLKKLINKKKTKVFISATEQSGDNIGYNIIVKLLELNKDIIIDGVGGSKMKKFFNKRYYSINDFKSIGIIEILFSLKKFIFMISFLKNKILLNNYDLVITIDSPDFHYPLVKKLKKNVFNCKYIHIVAPSVWAWRKNRAKKFSKVFDELLVLFNFEIKYFTKYNLKTTFIGHPIYYIKKNEFYKGRDNYIAFLPGSRFTEVKKLMRYFDLAYKYMLDKNINMKIFIPTLPHLDKYIKDYVKNWKIETIVSTDIIEIEKIYLRTNKAIVCSGTASLEIAKRNIPQIIIYKLNLLTEIIVKSMINIKFANILNIINNKMIIPEITNSQLNNKNFLIQLGSDQALRHLWPVLSPFGIAKAATCFNLLWPVSGIFALWRRNFTGQWCGGVLNGPFYKTRFSCEQ